MSLEEFKYDDYDLTKLYTIIPQKRDFKMLITPRHLNHYAYNPYEDFTADLLLNLSNKDTLFIDRGVICQNQ